MRENDLDLAELSELFGISDNTYSETSEDYE
jgi:predicted DNA binding protein